MLSLGGTGVEEASDEEGNDPGIATEASGVMLGTGAPNR
jgi:hypothetical protein